MVTHIIIQQSWWSSDIYNPQAFTNHRLRHAHNVEEPGLGNHMSMQAAKDVLQQDFAAAVKSFKNLVKYGELAAYHLKYYIQDINTFQIVYELEDHFIAEAKKRTVVNEKAQEPIPYKAPTEVFWNSSITLDDLVAQLNTAVTNANIPPSV